MKRIIDWFPLIALCACAIYLKGAIEAWVLTWVLILFLIGGVKWLFFWRFFLTGQSFSWWRVPFFFFLWVGLDPENFLNPNKTCVPPKGREWFIALLNMTVGLLLFYGGPRVFSEGEWLWISWFGIAGLLFFIYFGLVHLMALIWQFFGVRAEHIMNMPIATTSLSGFWRKNWNKAYHRMIFTIAYKPTRTFFGKKAALFVGFFLSGLIHELIFSYPYDGGYGWPTLFFVIQAVGISIERSRLGKFLKIRSGLRGRIFALGWLIASAGLLFHPVLAGHGLVPFMRAFHAI